MITKRIQRRNANILKYHERGYDTRTIGRIFHLSHTQVANIINKIKEVKGVIDKNFQLKNCKGCYFADTKKVGTEMPCCTYPSKLVVDPKTGECMSKRPKL